jgi:acetyl esterase/lipase
MNPPTPAPRRGFVRWLIRLGAALGVLLLLLALVIASGWAYLNPEVRRETGLVYGSRHGKDLTFDVLRPAKTNGLGVVVMVSGGWKSEAGSFPVPLAAPLLRRGYTVFPIYHLSQPESTIREVFADMSRGVRRVRSDAAKYGIDPDRIGVTGGSAGGHLSLMLATAGGAGNPTAVDPVDRASSAVQAVAIFYPVTDLLDLGDSTENLRDGGPPKSFVKAFRPDPDGPKEWKEIGRSLSPLHLLGSNRPPTLIHHGDADTLVPLDQSRRYVERARGLGNEIELVVHPGGRHGWPTMILDLIRFADWFDKHLAKAPSNGAER